jgi:hypothetical protein
VSIHKWPFLRRAAFSAGLRLRLEKWPAAAYRRTPSCPALRGPQTLVYPAIALSKGDGGCGPRKTSGISHLITHKGAQLARHQNCSFLDWTLKLVHYASLMDTNSFLLDLFHRDQKVKRPFTPSVSGVLSGEKGHWYKVKTNYDSISKSSLPAPHTGHS